MNKDKQVETEVKEVENQKIDNRFVLSASSNTSAAVDELTIRAKEKAKDVTYSEIKEAVKFINDNYNN